MRGSELRAVRLAAKPGYETLARILDDALDQAQSGKGHERHGEDGQLWEEQVMFQIADELGPGFNAGQFAKKMAESMRLAPEARRRELLGAVVYAASLVKLFEEA